MALEVGIWTLTVVLMLIGLGGSFVPAVPGAPLIFGAAVVHFFFIPGYVSVWTLGALGIMAAFALILDTLMSVGGAKWAGATSWGIVGSGIGALLGLFAGIVGVLVGAVLGAILAEVIFAKRPIKEAGKAGLGAGLGLLASSVGRAAVCLSMIVLFAVDCFWNP
jgi:uncharacterized protein YqgC (DUF456 family)